MAIDTNWFKEKITKSRHKSLRRFAPLIRTTSRGRTMDIAALSRMLHGKRPMSLDEANQIAILLDMPLTEIIRRAGFRI